MVQLPVKAAITAIILSTKPYRTTVGGESFPDSEDEACVVLFSLEGPLKTLNKTGIFHSLFMEHTHCFVIDSTSFHHSYVREPRLSSYLIYFVYLSASMHT